MKNPCLIIIDVQEKLVPVINSNESLINNIITLIKGFDLFNLPFLVTEQVPQKLGSTVDPIRKLLKNVKPISKITFSCVENLDFREWLNKNKNIDQILLCGIETHVCVYQTARDLIKKGYHTEVVSDAVSARNVNNHKIALSRLQTKGAHLTTTEMFLFDYQKSSEGKRFKKLNKLIK